MDKLNFKIYLFTVNDFTIFLRRVLSLLFYKMTSENKKQKRTAISDEIKHVICEFHTKNSHLSYIDIALHFNQLHNFDIKRTIISKILKDKGRWLSVITNPPI